MAETRGKLTNLVLEARRREPNRLLLSIAKEHGVSRQRVHQILQRAYRETNAPCYQPRRTGKFCRRCGNQMQYYLPCHQSKGDPSLCVVCVRELRMVPLTCAQCQQPFLRANVIVKKGVARGQVLSFCTRRCLGQYLGRVFGFVAHPENAFGFQIRKGNHWWTPLLPEIRQRRLQGATLTAAMRDLGIPRGNYSTILHGLEVHDD